MFESDRLRLPLDGHAPPGQDVRAVLGFRGADVVAGDGGRFRARIDVLPLGNETQVYVAAGENYATQLVLGVPSSVRPHEGEELRFDIPGSAIRWFDPDSGRLMAP
jgi:ABC-type sugar transport system ATPase subunit